MSYKFRTIFVCITILLLTSANTVYSASEKKVALIIGNGDYINAPLRNPFNDATDMASTLKQLGFKVTLITNADQRTMERSIRSFGRKLRQGGVGLFYYAGHGLQVKGRNYLIPIDAVIESESDVKYSSVDAGLILGKMEDAGNNLNIIILDACRNNPFARSFRNGEQGLAKMDAPTGSILAYSTAPGSVAADGDGRNGLYTEMLLKHMDQPGVDLPHLFMNVRKSVVSATNQKQVPWESSSLIGDFYFRQLNSGPKQAERAIDIQKRKAIKKFDAEEEMWAAVKYSEMISDYKAFLKEYPNSRFRGAANIKIKQLERRENAKKITASVSPQIALPEPTYKTPKISAVDGDLVKYSNAVIYDRTTDLEWYVGLDKDINWHEANAWVKNLKIGGGWKLPTKSQLESIYHHSTGRRKMSPLFETTGTWVWALSSNTAYGGGKYAYYFGGNAEYKYLHATLSKSMRVFGVRPRKTDILNNVKGNNFNSAIETNVANPNKEIVFLPSVFNDHVGATSYHQYKEVLEAIRDLPDLKLVHSYTYKKGSKKYDILEGKWAFSESMVNLNAVKSYCKGINGDLGIILHTYRSSSFGGKQRINIYLIDLYSWEIVQSNSEEVDYNSILNAMRKIVKKSLNDYTVVNRQ
jgi:hypothetical protein